MEKVVQIAILGGFGGEKAKNHEKRLDKTDTLIRVLLVRVTVYIVHSHFQIGITSTVMPSTVI